MNKIYKNQKNSHYHIIADAEGKQYDLAINIGSILEQNGVVKSSDLRVCYEEEYTYNRKILKEMLLQKEGVTEARKGLCLDYSKMKLFPHDKLKLMKGFSEKEIFLTELIEENICKMMLNERFEIFVFGKLYSNKKGIHDIHLNQGSRGKHKLKDSPFSDGAIFFFDRKVKKWKALFIAFRTQTLRTDRNGKAL